MNGVPTFGEFIRQRRTTANLTRPQLAWLANLSVPYLTKIEAGANPSRRVTESLSSALQLNSAEHEYALTLAEGPAPRIEADHPSESDLEYLQLLPKPAAFISATLDMLAVNEPHRAIFQQLDPGTNMLEWLFLNPLSRTVLVDWMGEAQNSVGLFRLQLARRGEDDRAREVVENCLVNPDFAMIWRSDSVSGDPGSTTKLVRDPQTLAIREMHVKFWQAPGLQSWWFTHCAIVDQPTAVTRPVVRERPISSTPLNTSGDPNSRAGQASSTTARRDPTPTQPLQLPNSKQLDG
ncbi:helix-turn-helix domain-containing protein [Nocardia huaxiensis]|uniref:Helix-turn-helix domain-containing protein n=1 Tax=Nocardia huaxiensis TaxID=2755382 RepID=A0A7D6VGP2_9NOCA|nr:helix-turn-helix domain-containing protein [Nocardia huaxiensis]QLY32295.1 helix-turn-helix domain-containing protein [Nocardia huaxiensis]UFS94000.1 helix-turn-helix transcriptional regulator [Nocardia huaxiensis]